MTVEVELKLHISPEHLQKLKRHPFLRSLSADRAPDSANGSLRSGGEPIGLPLAGTLLMKRLAIRLGEQTTLAKSLVMAKPADCGRERPAVVPAPEGSAPPCHDRARTLKLYSIYYDTADLALRQQGMALRLRRVGKQWLQTLKGGGQVSAGLHQRNEWETPVLSEQLDFDALKACGGELPHGVRNRLQPVFVTNFSRNARLLNFEGAQIELCMDSGEIRAGQSSCPISELELELKAGEPQQLFKLAQALLDIVPLQVEHTSKAEYGYLLFSPAKPSVSKARFLPLKKSQSIAGALQSLIGGCLAHVQSNVPGALLKLDEEYLHQVRVGLRRLRVVISIALRFHADPELTALREQVAKLCVELGRSREWDVFVTQTLAPICTRLPEHDGLREVLNVSERARKKQHAGMESNLASQDFQRMLLRFGAWMYSDQTGDAETTLEQFAGKMLKKRSTCVVKHGSALIGEDAEKLHTLRIACKKLRYSIEMFGGLFAKTRAKDYVAALAELQDILGVLNDIAVAHRLLNELDNAARHDTLALIRGWMEHDYAERVAEFGKAWKQFMAQKEFWN